MWKTLELWEKDLAFATIVASIGVLLLAFLEDARFGVSFLLIDGLVALIAFGDWALTPTPKENQRPLRHW